MKNLLSRNRRITIDDGRPIPEDEVIIDCIYTLDGWIDYAAQVGDVESPTIDASSYLPTYWGEYIPYSEGDFYYCPNLWQWCLPRANTVDLHTESGIKKATFLPFVNVAVVIDAAHMKFYATRQLAEKMLGEPVSWRDGCCWAQSVTVGPSSLKGKAAKMHRMLPDIMQLQLHYKAGEHNATFNAIRRYYFHLEVPVKNPIFTGGVGGVLVGDKTFGIEYECSKFSAPLYEFGKYGLVPLRDGSLPSGGMEICTVPLSGERGLQTIQDGLGVLSPNCEVNMRCSLHISWGNLPRSKEFAVALYMLYYRLQDEILDMMPHYLRNPVEVGRKNKNYADRLLSLNLMNGGYSQESIEEAYNKVHNIFLGMDATDDNVEAPWRGESWNSATRYSQLNMVKYLMNKSSTGIIEFRVHPPTFNKTKVFAWLFLTNAIIRYAEANTLKILNSKINREKILLEDVIMGISNNFGEKAPANPLREALAVWLIAYVLHLKEKRGIEEIKAIQHGNEQGGLSHRHAKYRELVAKEFSEDRKFNFNHNGFEI